MSAETHIKIFERELEESIKEALTALDNIKKKYDAYLAKVTTESTPEPVQPSVFEPAPEVEKIDKGSKVIPVTGPMTLPPVDPLPVA